MIESGYVKRVCDGESMVLHFDYFYIYNIRILKDHAFKQHVSWPLHCKFKYSNFILKPTNTVLSLLRFRVIFIGVINLNFRGKNGCIYL